MNDNEKIIRQLTIRSYHVIDVDKGSFCIDKIKNNDLDTVSSAQKKSLGTNLYRVKIGNFTRQIIDSCDLILDSSIKIIKPGERNINVNSIMDIIPLSVKALGRIGEGITNTLTGVYVILTGHDVDGNQICAFGNSDGNLDDQIMWNRAGTPNHDDILILVDVTLKSKAGYVRSGPDAIHRACDLFCNEIRKNMLNLKGRDCTESHVFEDIIRPGKKRVAIVKMVPGQGAMYDCRYLPNNPSGFIGGHSIIDAEGAPMIISPNEYRDGAIRALV